VNPEQLLRRLGACGEALDWVRGRAEARAWQQCPRGDWLFWLAARSGLDPDRLRGCAIRCVGLAVSLRVDLTPTARRDLCGIKNRDLWVRAYHAGGLVFELGAAADDISPKLCRLLLKGAANIVREELSLVELRQLCDHVVASEDV